MKRFVISFALLFGVVSGIFAQNDWQPLARVKLNGSEVITLKQLKIRAEFVKKQYEANGVSVELSVDDRKQLLDGLINEKLISQAALKENLKVSGTEVNTYFLSTFSQQLGQQVSEAQLSEIIKRNTGLSLDEYIKQNTGMSLDEYKLYLESQLTAQKYIINKKQAELQAVAATDEEIRAAYDMNKAQFVQNDMMKLFLVVVPKGTDAVTARATATDLLNKYKANPKSEDSIKNSTDNSSKYQAGNIIVAKTSEQAKQLGWDFSKMQELFAHDVGYVSSLSETENDFQFYAVLKKYEAKMLSLSDLVQPETTITVYDYIKQTLTSQKQSQFLSVAAQQIAKDLNKPENVERVKTGDALTNLLNW